jgi:lipopolysaccharide/colanic/teichoic acid biosynthesis glycosyltransferase
VFKRMIDVISAFLLLTLSLPLLAIAAIFIKLDSDGPVLFRQARMGRRFRGFQLYKLRTMNFGGEGTAYTLGADPRITRTGRWLRRFKIDELPQLWNVLRGDMSMVGPRPVIPQLAFQFDRDYERLLAVRPGLTDPASLKYCRETEILQAAADADSYFKTVVIPDKIRISQSYLERASLWSDLVIAIQTVLVLALPRLQKKFSGPIPQPQPKPNTKGVLCFPATANSNAAHEYLEGSSKATKAEVPPAILELPPAILGNSTRPRAAPRGESMPI